MGLGLLSWIAARPLLPSTPVGGRPGWGAARGRSLCVALALAGCSSSASPPASHDGGARDVTTQHDAGARDVVTDAGHDATHPHDARHDTRVHHDAGDAGLDAPLSKTDAPAATTLTLSLPMTPAFSVSIHDYYVRCAAGDNAITVTMTAAPGSTIGLVQPTVTTPSVASTVSVSVPEGAAIVASVVKGAGDAGGDEYWVRCLPADFATLEMETHLEAGVAPAGYYLVGDLYATNAVDGGYAMALDPNGVPVWYTKSATEIEPMDVESVSAGTISLTPFIVPTFDATAAGQFEIHDLAAGTTTYATTVGSPLDVHELRILSNGDYLMLSDPLLMGQNLTGLGTFGANENMEGCVIQEVSPSGTLVWQWNALDYLDPIQDCTYPVGKTYEGMAVATVFHCNSLDVDETAGTVLLSARDMDTVMLIDMSTSAIVWKMGGSTYTKTGAPYIEITSDPRTSFYRQHDARLMPGGMVSMFDDHSSAGGPSRAVIYSVDTTTGTATMVWQYTGTANSGGMGSFRVLPDGSRVIGWGLGYPGLAFTEVDEAGRDLKDFIFPDKRFTYRALKVPSSAFDIATLRKATQPTP
jgi:hypothetical protein